MGRGHAVCGQKWRIRNFRYGIADGPRALLGKPVHTLCLDAAGLAFLRRVERTYPVVELHVILDNVSTHKTPAVQAWLAAHPRVTFHFTPTSASWLNQVET